MNKGIMAGIAGLVFAGAVGAIILTGEEDNEMPESITQEHQVCPRAVISSGGRHVRVVGIFPLSTDVRETSVGRVVVGNLSKRSLCLVVFEAKEIDDNPSLSNDLWAKRGMEPVKIQGSLLDDKWVWWSLFKSNGCNLIADHPGYFGSTLKEFLALPLATQARFLKTDGICKDEEEKDRPCTVPVGDPRAIANGTVSFPNSLMGRPDLSFVEEIGGVLQDRVVIPAEIE